MDESKVEEKPKKIVELKGSASVVSDAKVNMSVDGLSALEKQEVVTMPSGDYHFRKPKLKHRDIIVKIWKRLTAASINYGGAQKVMEKRNLKSIQELAAIPEGEFEPEEIALLMDGIGGDKNLEDVVAVMADALYCTLEKAPWPFTTQAELEDKIDYDEGILLANNAILWIKDTVIGLKERKNLQSLSNQEKPQ